MPVEGWVRVLFLFPMKGRKRLDRRLSEQDMRYRWPQERDNFSICIRYIQKATYFVREEGSGLHMKSGARAIEAPCRKLQGIFDRKEFGRFMIRPLPIPQAAGNTLALSVQAGFISTAASVPGPAIHAGPAGTGPPATAHPKPDRPRTHASFRFPGRAFAPIP